MVTATPRKFLTLEEIGAKAPSALASGPDEYRSDRYQFVPSSDVISRLDSLGWGVAAANQPRTREADANHVKHSLVFQPRDESLSWEDPRIKVINHGRFHMNNAVIRPTINLLNSSNGTTRIEFKVGLFALICANGLIIGVGSAIEISEKHYRGFNLDDALNVVQQATNKLANSRETVNRWAQVEMTPDRNIAFAEQASRIVWPDGVDNPDALLAPRRPEDNNLDNLWTTFNVVQENIIQGGIKANSRTSRGIVEVSRQAKVNESLWDLANGYSLN